MFRIVVVVVVVVGGVVLLPWRILPSLALVCHLSQRLTYCAFVQHTMGCGGVSVFRVSEISRLGTHERK